MDHLECRSYMKQRLKLLISDGAAKTLITEKSAFEQQIAESATSVFTSKYRAYRYNTSDRICRFYGSPGGIHVAVKRLLQFIQPNGVVIKMPGTGMHFLNGLNLVKFVVNIRVANRLLKRHRNLVHDICLEETTSFNVCRFTNRQTNDKCIIVIGDMETVMKASLLILHVIVDCSIPHLKSMKVCQKSYDIWSKSRLPNGHFMASNTGAMKINIPLCFTADGHPIPYSYLEEAGYDDDYVTALHFAYLIKLGGNPSPDQIFLNISIQNQIQDVITTCGHNS